MKERKKSFFKQSKPVQDILKIKMKSLGAGSLLKLNESESKLAVEIFALVVKIMDLLPDKIETLQLLIPKEAKLSDEAAQKILALCKKFRK